MTNLCIQNIRLWWWIPFLTLIRHYPLLSNKREREREMKSFVSNLVSHTSTVNEVTTLNVQAQSNSNGKSSYRNSSKGKSQGYSGPKGRARVCTHYERTNHTIETYVLKHGFPPGYKGNGKVTGTTANFQPAAMTNNAFENQSIGSSTTPSFGSYSRAVHSHMGILATVTT